MKHLFVTMDFAPSHGGVARYYEHLVRTFPKDTVTVLAPIVDGAKEDDSLPIVRTRFFSRKAWPRWLPLVFSLTKQIRVQKPEYLHIGQVVPVGTAALLANRASKVPMIVYSHGMDLLFAEKRPWRRWVAKRVLQKARWVVANSQFTAGCVRRFGVPEEKILRVLPGVSLWPATFSQERKSALQQQLGLATGKRVVLSVARLVERKGIDSILKALAALPTDIDWTYCIVGEGIERKQLEALASTLKLRDRVHFFGATDDETLKALYSLCDLFVLAPKASDEGRDVEGFGMVFLEANAFGKPVIASDTGGVSDAVHNGVNGILVPPDDILALTDALENLLKNPEASARLGASAYTNVKNHCQWPQRVELLFKKLGIE